MVQPHLRFCPIVFLLSHSEDHESHALLLKKFVEMSKQAGVSLTHGFFDCHCYNGASAALDSDETQQGKFALRRAEERPCQRRRSAQQ